MDTAQISTDQRRLLLLYFELIFESGAYVDGHLLSYQDIGKLFTRDLVSQHASLGINGFFSRFVTFTVKVKYSFFWKFGSNMQMFDICIGGSKIV
jgi:hypothetical protein